MKQSDVYLEAAMLVDEGFSSDDCFRAVEIARKMLHVLDFEHMHYEYGDGIVFEHVAHRVIFLLMMYHIAKDSE